MKKRGPNYDWERLKTEFLTGKEHILSKFFRPKKIPRGTWGHHTKGWKKEREKFQHEVDTEIKEVTKKARVLSAAQQAEYLSGVVAGSLNRWKILSDKLTRLENALEADPSTKERNRLHTHLSETARYLPELMKTLELLAGRATARPEVRDKTKKELEQLQKQYDEKRARLEELAKGGPLKIVKKKKTG